MQTNSSAYIAAMNGHTWRTTNRAKDKLGIVPTVDPEGRVGYDYLWTLPKRPEI